MLRKVREHQNSASQPQENALLVLGLPRLFQYQNRNFHGKLQGYPSQVGHRHLNPHSPYGTLIVPPYITLTHYNYSRYNL